MGAVAPFELPFLDWPSSPEARNWLRVELLPVVGPPLVAAVIFPVLLCLCGLSRCAFPRRGKVPRRQGVKGVIVAGVTAAAALILAAYAVLLLVGTASALEGATLNTTAQASQFTCAPMAPQPPMPGGDACASSSPVAPEACAATSLIGFAANLAEGTLTATDAAAAFLGSVGAAADKLVPLVATSAQAADLATGLADNVSILNTTIVELQAVLRDAHATGAPYFPNEPTMWAPLAQLGAYEVPALPAASVRAVEVLAAELRAQHDQMDVVVANAEAATREQTAPATWRSDLSLGSEREA